MSAAWDPDAFSQNQLAVMVVKQAGRRKEVCGDQGQVQGARLAERAP